MRPLILSLGFVLGTAPITGQPEKHGSTDRDLLRTCIQVLVVPQFPIASRAAGIEGRAEVTLRWGPNGEFEPSIKASSKDFERVVAEALKKSLFSAECRSCTLKLVFEFEIDPERSHLLRQEVKFVPPLTFRVVANLMELNP